jgi:hypothetical protein
MYKTITTYVVDPKTRLDKIMPDGIPVNAFIDKGRCAIGGTYSEITNKRRSSLIPVPNISILLCKKLDHPEIDIVYGDVSYEDVKRILLIKKAGHKILTTPEGMRKIMKAAAEVGRLEEIYKEWFLLLDEAHTFSSESYRDDILAPFDYFWNFAKKAVISATPYEFTDPRFKTLDYHKISFKKKLGTVKVVIADSTVATLNYILQNLDKFPGNLHIFYNSVTQIVAAIRRAGLTLEQCIIFCANDQKGKNMRKLGDLISYFVSEPAPGIYKKVCFYTSKYFEGWDLYDQDATIILVSDEHRPQTCVGPSSKGKQAFGRLRSGKTLGDEPHALIHLTSCKDIRYMRPLNEFRAHFLEEAKISIINWNLKVQRHNIKGIEIKNSPDMEKYADVSEETNIATLNIMKLDQQINEAAGNEIYNHIDFIKKDWEDGYFHVESIKAHHKVENVTAMKRKSKAQQLKEDYLKLVEYKNSITEKMVFTFGQTLEEEIKERNPTAYSAFVLLNESTMIDLKYNVKEVETAIILKENTMAELKLARLLNQQFKAGQKCVNSEIKNKLQRIYNQLNIRTENGKIKVAKASDLVDNGWFEMTACKLKDSKGNFENGQLIIRANFNLLMAA